MSRTAVRVHSHDPTQTDTPRSEYAGAAEYGFGARYRDGHPLTAATCRDTHVGGVTLCTASTARVSDVRLRVTVRRVNPLSLLVDTDAHQGQ